MEESNNYIPLIKCEDRKIYRIHSRNLSVGVYRASTKGFIGIRSKFEAVYLFEEYHWDVGPPNGTVKPKEVIGELPANIKLVISLRSIDSKTRRKVFYDDTPDENGNGRQGFGENEVKVRGWRFSNTGESNKDIRAVSVSNSKLFNYLGSLK